MKQGLIKYLTIFVFCGTLASNFEAQCIDNPVKLPGQIGWLLPVTLLYTLTSATKKIMSYVGGTNSQAAVESSVPVTPPAATIDITIETYPNIIVDEPAQRLVAPISEKILEFGKRQFESISNTAKEGYDAITCSSPVKAGVFVWNHKYKIGLALGALALYKKYKESKKDNKNIVIINKSGSRPVFINKQK